MNPHARHADVGVHRRRLGILVGPGVVQAGCVAGMRAFAERVGCGVVNTWGAKGVLPWDDPLHFGTAGLQERDFELAGLGAVDVLVTSGLDPDEVLTQPWLGRAEVIDVAPTALATATLDLPPGTLERPALYGTIAAVVTPMYADPATPPARAAALADALPSGGLVVGTPGLVGFWIARTFPTAVPGSVVVPARGGVEAAVAVANAAADGGRRVTLVAPTEPKVTRAGVLVEVWHPGEVDLDPASLVAVAGEIVAWRHA